jgi:hypothetical protein
MAAITTSMGPKPFTWSYSKLKNFEACPKKHYEIDLRPKNDPLKVKEEESDQLLWGNIVHKGFEDRLGPKKVPLPESMKIYEPWAQRVEEGPGDIHVEVKLALTKQFGTCGYFAPDVWFRAKGDVIKVHGRVARIIDWKTGKIVEDSCQLALSAACTFAMFPEVQKIRSTFAWLGQNAKTDEDFTRDDMPGLWRGLWPRIQALEHAHNTTTYQAKPGGLCRSWCPVTSCPHHGVGG